MELPRRKSPRIPGYDYRTTNYYFITICTSSKKCIFGKPGELNWMGKCAEECLRIITDLHPYVRLDKYVVMPNHIHAVFDVQDQENRTDLAVILGQYKSSVTKRIRERKPEIEVWQRSFHDHVIRNQQTYEKIWMYIEDNPRKWKEDCFYVQLEEDDKLREGQ